jgi:phosphoribosylanthranilate isomerase
MKPFVKICGISDFHFLNEIIELEGINYLGFIFYEKSPRYVNQEFLNKLKNFNFRDKRPVCVYVNASKEYIKETSSYFKDPILQFHGDETNEFCKSHKNEFWKAIRIKDHESLKEITNYNSASAILFESYKKGIYGGSGESFDWKIIENINLTQKNVLSGGISIKNVDNAIRTQPWCIDINSGVESSIGIKDINLVKDILKKLY